VARENAELRQRLAELKGVEEDLAAKRVFEKAKGYLFGWITISGLVLTVSGVIGIKAAYDYATTLVKAKIDAISKEEVERRLEAEGQKVLGVIVEKKTIELDVYAKGKIDQILLASRPIKSLTVTTAPPPSGALDLAADIRFVRDSGAEGSVVGQALATGLDYLILKSMGEARRTSARHIYYLARLEGGLGLDADSGAFLKDGIKGLTGKGTVEEAVWPYRAGEYKTPPPAGVAPARKFRIADAELLNGLDDIRRALSAGRAVVVGLSLLESSGGADVGKTGVLRVGSGKEQVVGGHAVCLVGYDDAKGRLKFVNSWGTGWGERGFGYIPYDYFAKYGSEAWAFSLARA
jgi:Papain family cysteine protease